MLVHASEVLNANEAAPATSSLAFGVCNAGSGLVNAVPGGQAVIEASDEATVRGAEPPAAGPVGGPSAEEAEREARSLVQVADGGGSSGAGESSAVA